MRLFFITRWGHVCLGAWLLLLATPGASAVDPKRVLILDPYGQDVAPFSTVLAAFRSTLAREFGGRVEFYETSLERARFREPEAEDPFVAFLRSRMAARPMDLVVTVGGPGMDFVARHHEGLFPDIPVVFMAGPPVPVRTGSLSNKSAQVTHPLNLAGMVEDILQLRPETTNIVVVFGASTLESLTVNNCRHEFQRFTNRVAFTWLNELPLEQVLERCANLPPRSFILHGLFLVDSAGVPFERNEPLRRLHAVANAPLFGYFASELGLGPMGGRLYQDSEVGVQAARAAIRILHGESAGQIPLQILAEAPPAYDDRELQRWNINTARLPAGSVVRFREPGFWGRHRWLIVGTVLFCSFQAALIVGLLVHRARRKRADERFRLTVEASPNGVVLVNESGQIMLVNQRTEVLFGYARAELMGRSVELLLPERVRAVHAGHVQDFLAAPKTRGMGAGRDLFARRRDGTEFPVEIGLSPIQSAEGRLIMVTIVDITVRKQTDAAMHDLSRRLIHAHEAERARLGRELHDDVTQRLAVLAIDVGRVEPVVGGTSAAETMRTVREGLVGLSEDIHALSYRLHPAVLEDLGLGEALKAECERFARQESIPAEVMLPPLPDALPPETALCLIRVAQEALRNVARHARARRVEVSVRVLDGGLELAVIDDGIGFEPDLPRERPSLGLASMQERVLLLGGELDIESAPGRGTTILVSLPLPKAEG